MRLNRQGSDAPEDDLHQTVYLNMTVNANGEITPFRSSGFGGTDCR